MAQPPLLEKEGNVHLIRFMCKAAHQPNFWPGIQVSAGTVDLQAAKQRPRIL